MFDPDQPELLQVGNYLIDEDRVLGAGEFGKVYLAQEIPEVFDMTRNCDVSMDVSKSRFGRHDDSVVKQNNIFLN